MGWIDSHENYIDSDEFDRLILIFMIDMGWIDSYENYIDSDGVWFQMNYTDSSELDRLV